MQICMVAATQNFLNCQPMRKIIHVDMDAYYVSVELLRRPELRGKPVAVAGKSQRAVVATASYEARKFGVHSAMPIRQALKLCPSLITVRSDFPLYREISAQIREIFHYYTDLVEAPSLDEAYLDVTEDFRNVGSATQTAQNIRKKIFEKTQLTASAGVAPSKFLAKIASDWNKPNGIMVVPPSKVMEFLLPLPLEKIPGVGKVTLARMHKLKMYTVSDLASHSLGELTLNFGKYGYRLHELAQGIDNRPVRTLRPRKQVSAETTFERDLRIEQMQESIDSLQQKVMQSLAARQMVAYGVTLKLKTSNFKILTRSRSMSSPIHTLEDFRFALKRILDELTPAEKTDTYRLVGVGLSELMSAQDCSVQPDLFG